MLLARQASLRARLEQLGTTMKVYAGTFASPDRPICSSAATPRSRAPRCAPSAIAAVRPHSS